MAEKISQEKVVQLNKDFYNQTANAYDREARTSVFDENNQKRTNRILDTIIGNRKNLRILDAGCGTGNILKLLRERERERDYVG